MVEGLVLGVEGVGDRRGQGKSIGAVVVGSKKILLTTTPNARFL